MYASAARAGLGVIPQCDFFGNEGLMPGDPGYDATLVYDDTTGCWVSTDGTAPGSPDITLTPTTITTQLLPVQVPTALAPPITVTPQMFPQPLPPLTVTVSPAPASASSSGGLLLLLLLGGLYLAGRGH